MRTGLNTFPGFTKHMPAFFRGLEKNNDREWFNAHRESFERDVRLPMIELVSLVNENLRKFALEYVAANPARALYRIHRDTRFSKDKTPYKTQLGATFHRQGLSKNGAAGFYFGVSHKHVEVAAGMYMPDPDTMRVVRQAIARDGKTFIKLFADRKLTKVMGPLQGERLTRLPKGFEEHAGTPAADYIRWKQWYWYLLLPAKTALSREIRREVVTRFKLMKEAVDWLNDAVLAARAAEGEGEAIPKRPEPMW